MNDLLNPHGSDETWVSKSLLKADENFLTHTVQMKPIEYEDVCPDKRSFLTHTVQMKPSSMSIFCCEATLFLTHTVQMKLFL